jgi:DNA ligase 1
MKYTKHYNQQKIKNFIFYICLNFLFFVANSQSATPPAIQQGNLYYEGVDLKEYFVSEKLDGVRAYWNGENLISKQGNIIKAPECFTKDFPKQDLEGELWMSHNQFEITSGIVRRETTNDEDWSNITLMLFDMPKHSGTFEERLEAMKQIVTLSNSSHLKLIEQYKLPNHKSLMAKLQEVMRNGGEGLMLHRAKSYYIAKRNNDVLKVKSYEDDEAKVIAHIAGKGKYQGMLGSLLVENRDKVQFKIGTGFSDEQRKNPPKIGAIITYKFYGKSKNNKPKFASFIRVREGYIFE